MSHVLVNNVSGNLRDQLTMIWLHKSMLFFQIILRLYSGQTWYASHNNHDDTHNTTFPRRHHKPSIECARAEGILLPVGMKLLEQQVMTYILPRSIYATDVRVKYRFPCERKSTELRIL